MKSRLRSGRWIAATIATLLLVAGCGSSSGTAEADPNDRVLSSSAVEEATRFVEPGSGSNAAPTDAGLNDGEPDELAAAEDARPNGRTYPLTGLAVPTDDVGIGGRAALVVKVDNHPRARPQSGLDQADIVFDVRAEGVTRFAAVFHSSIPDPVGPVRSSRTSDFDILRGFERPLYASSGGNDYVARNLRSLPIVELTNLTRTEYFRDFSRPAPHNLYVNGSDLYQLAPTDLSAPEPWFQYQYGDGPSSPLAVPSTGPVTVDYTGSPTVTHTWDESLRGWLRTQDNNPHTTVNGDQLAPENVVIMVTSYGVSPADPISPEVRSTGSGPALVLSNGQIVAGTWDRPTAVDKPTLLDANGNEILLSPGRTWVLMPEPGQVTLPAGTTIAGWDG